ncbi:exonuclease domain-containing protein [Paenirhodobacter populi]|uniref:exonuclease domain-containing protein n=1 Tax=Paenirhodobacter populi TaxID=2306993 RepID=UPI000FE3894D|nr:exonuclease domain-containing protein [Sinirhodobacter populi]RWR09128.1 exonuclease [Sinirhodobacter populi]
MTPLDPLPGPPPKPQDTPRRRDFGHLGIPPEGDFRFVALDVETACGDAGSICQIGLACVLPDNGIRTFSMLVNPGTRFDPFNIRLHGIGPGHVADAPDFPQALALLLPLLRAHPLIQHSNFDRLAIQAACRAHGIEPPALRWSDSVAIARRAWPELKGNGGHGLANLKRVLRLQFHHHDAGEDARAAALVVLHAETRLALPFEQLTAPRPAPRTRAARPVPVADPEGPLAGAVVVFTGSLGIPRDRAAEMAARAGMEVAQGVTERTTHLVVGPGPATALQSTKLRKAEQLRAAGYPIRIIDESAFRALVDPRPE